MKFLKAHAAIILSLFSGLLYLFTAAPFTLWLDAPRFVSAIVTMGVPNPPEPLYLILAKPFTYLPFGSPIFRIQIFSALSAALALLMLNKVAVRIFKDIWGKVEKSLLTSAALFSTATLAFSYQFWSQAQNVETFILVTLLAISCLYLILTTDSKKKFFINLCAVAGILGLATGTNPVIASIVPSILWVMWHKRKFWTIPGFIIWFLIGIVAIVAIHLYIPLRAQVSPFLNYWNARDFESVWNVSTGAGLNVYVPELGRVNGFTGSPEVFLKSTWHYLEILFIKFTPLLLPFMIAGLYFLWKKSRYYFIFLGLIILTNWLFSSLYFSGNQESWFLMSDLAWVILGGIGFYWASSGGLAELKIRGVGVIRGRKFSKFAPYLLLASFIPLLVWFPFLNRRGWVLTEDYIENLYRPIGNEKAIIFGSSDLYDSASFLVHDVSSLPTYKPNVVPITDNLLYIMEWYRDHLKNTTDLKIPDDKGFKYDSVEEYSKFINDFFAANMDKYKIFVTIPAARNNFLQAYGGKNLGPSLKIDETRFQLIPQGMVFEVRDKEATSSSDLAYFDYKFKNKDFPKKKPFMLEQTYKSELTGVLNEYAYSLEALGDSMLKDGKAEDAFKYYQKAYDFNPKNAEIVSRLGNYYGNIGDHQKAAEYFEKALKIEPNNIGLLFNSAIAYENIGKIDKAIKNYNKVIQLSKGQDQIGQLAQVRLNALKSATPSGTLATESGSLQQQLLQAPRPQSGFQANNLQFFVPQGFKVTEDKGTTKLSNNLTGRDELTFWFYSRKMKEGEKLEALGENVPFSLEGPVLITQPVNIPGFESVGKTYGSGEHITFLLLMKKGDSGVAVKIYPGDSSKTEEFNQILGSIQVP